MVDWVPCLPAPPLLPLPQSQSRRSHTADCTALHAAHRARATATLCAAALAAPTDRDGALAREQGAQRGVVAAPVPLVVQVKLLVKHADALAHAVLVPLPPSGE
jgi:hypothetical protein